MADFYEAYKITMKHEGGYVNDKDDVGGETYCGIARNYNPSWEGWQLIDSLKAAAEAVGTPIFPANAYDNKEIDRLVKKFYKERYWDVNLLDHCTSQDVANEMFDTGVNMGTARAGKFLQKALNLLNDNGKRWDDIVEDGVVGKNTLKALDACLAFRSDDTLYKILNILQGMHYIEYMTKSPIQEKYAYGWLSRVDFIKK